MAGTLAHHREGSGEPLLLLHGIGCQWQYYGPVIPALVATRDVIAVDLPGFGDSAPLAVTPTLEALTDAVESFIDDLGFDKVHVAGNSLGGGVALELGVRGRARSVTCLSPTGFWTDREAAFCRASVATTIRATKLLAPAAPVIGRTGAGRAAVLAQQCARGWRIPPEDFVRAVRNAASSPGFESTRVAALRGVFHGSIDVPVTIAWAEHDRLLLPRQARRAMRLLPGARHVTLRGCGHLPFWDDPDQVARVLIEGSAAGVAEPRATEVAR
jgi:pimeloyl-ACP methyl ester carboxylesterase